MGGFIHLNGDELPSAHHRQRQRLQESAQESLDQAKGTRHERTSDPNAPSHQIGSDYALRPATIP